MVRFPNHLLKTSLVMPSVSPRPLGSAPVPVGTAAQPLEAPGRGGVSMNTEERAADAPWLCQHNNVPPGGQTAVALGTG